MVSCLEADAVPKTVTSCTVWHSWEAAMPTPPVDVQSSGTKRNQDGGRWFTLQRKAVWALCDASLIHSLNKSNFWMTHTCFTKHLINTRVNWTHFFTHQKWAAWNKLWRDHNLKYQKIHPDLNTILCYLIIYYYKLYFIIRTIFPPGSDDCVLFVDYSWYAHVILISKVQWRHPAFLRY